jgi:hypothetical protein
VVGTGEWKSGATIYSKTVLPIGTHKRTPRPVQTDAQIGSKFPWQPVPTIDSGTAAPFLAFWFGSFLFHDFGILADASSFGDASALAYIYIHIYI